MNNFKKYFIITSISILLLCSPKANALTVSSAVDKTINGTAKATYFVTKYTLKGSWFVIKKTAKGIKVVSKSIFRATKDAFRSSPKTQPSGRSPASYYSDNSLPPPPPILE